MSATVTCTPIMGPSEIKNQCDNNNFRRAIERLFESVVSSNVFTLRLSTVEYRPTRSGCRETGIDRSARLHPALAQSLVHTEPIPAAPGDEDPVLRGQGLKWFIFSPWGRKKKHQGQTRILVPPWAHLIRFKRNMYDKNLFHLCFQERGSINFDISTSRSSVCTETYPSMSEAPDAFNLLCILSR